MILHWDQLPLHYGSEVASHRSRFEAATQTTYALLCCKFLPGDDRLVPSQGDHAEQRILASPTWRTDLPAALQGWSPLNHSQIVVTLALNRSPCRACARALSFALKSLQWRHALAFQNSRFLLASRGAYQGKVSSTLDYYDQATTTGDLKELRDAGWELCVLQLGGQLAPSGRELLQTLARDSGKSGVLRLSSP